ncbi:MAG TPA: hypothetical protein VGN63_09095 [Flavisolibacter sp.]|jgi:hypothetical protein|nr:hypothetical protein [Flavisolibacter sp.]
MKQTDDWNNDVRSFENFLYVNPDGILPKKVKMKRQTTGVETRPLLAMYKKFTSNPDS